MKTRRLRQGHGPPRAGSWL